MHLLMCCYGATRYMNMLMFVMVLHVQVNPSTYRLKIEMEPYSISETPDASDISVSLDVPVSTNAPLEPKLLASFSLDDLKEMPSTTIVSTLQCAGNRRAEMSKV